MTEKRVILAGYGYLGKYILNQTPDKHRDMIYKLSRNKETHATNIGQHIQVDFDKNDCGVREITEGSVIIYMAPPNQNKDGDPRLMNFLNKLSEEEKSIKKIIYISTSGVYGDCGGALVDEDAELRPITDRAKRRVAAEELVLKYARDKSTDFIILRVPGIYGHGRLPLDRIKERQPLIHIRQCKITNLIHVEDLARVVWSSIAENITNEIINVSDGNPITTTEYYLKIYEALKIERPNFISAKEAANLYSKKRMEFINESRVLNISKLNKLMPGCIYYKDLLHGVRKSLT